MADFLNTYLFHWHPSKAIWIGGHTLSWDARCSGIYIGFGVGVLYHIVADRKAKNLPSRSILFVNALLFIPLFLDIFSIKYGFRQPSNDVRYFTGLLFGAAFSVYLYPAFIMLTSSNTHDNPAINRLTGFIAILTPVACAFFLKSWDTFVAYLILEGLAIIGFVSLLEMLALPLFKILANSGIKG